MAVEIVTVGFGEPRPGKNIGDDFVHAATSRQRSLHRGSGHTAAATASCKRWRQRCRTPATAPVTPTSSTEYAASWSLRLARWVRRDVKRTNRGRLGLSWASMTPGRKSVDARSVFYYRTVMPANLSPEYKAAEAS